MEALFRRSGIYSSEGQKYRPVDSTTLSPYREAKDGQILQEGICEAGAMASFLAAGTAYALHGVPTIPFYVFYSIFGFQRVGDMIWSAGDMLCRGFLLGGTSGRTTLNGEGPQHQDGHTQVIANTVPNMRSYDPAFAYELAVIIRDGIQRMYGDQEDVFYYITIHNQNYAMPPMPEGAAEGIVHGMYRFQRSARAVEKGRKAHLFGSGAIMTEVLEAARLLEDAGIATDIWSVTSYNELRRDALRVDRLNRLRPTEPEQAPYFLQALGAAEGPIIASTDYMKIVPDQLAPWLGSRLVSLGTDGFGRSEDRLHLRRHFEISAEAIVAATLSKLAREGKFNAKKAVQALTDLGFPPEKLDPAGA